MHRILMVSCQEIGATTGSGVVVQESSKRLSARGHAVRILHGHSRRVTTSPTLPGVVQSSAVTFGAPDAELPFDVVGMSNQMPYPSMRFADLTGERLASYIRVWRRHLDAAIADFQPDVLHIHHLWLLVPLAFEVAPNRPLAVSLHGTELHRALDAPHIMPLVAPAAARIDRCLALTESMVTRATAAFGLPPDRFAVLGNGYDDRTFFCADSTAPAGPPGLAGRADAAGSKDAQGLDRIPKVMFVGKLARWKGVDHLLRAFARVVHRARIECSLDIAGAGPELEHKRYASLATRLGIHDRVRFLGHLTQPEIATRLNRTTVFVLPSIEEPFGLALLEAIACGCRTVAAHQGGPAEFVPSPLRDDGSATLVPGLSGEAASYEETERYIEALAAAIAGHLSTPLTHQERRRVSSQVTHLVWDRYVDKLEHEYDLARVSRGAM